MHLKGQDMMMKHVAVTPEGTWLQALQFLCSCVLCKDNYIKKKLDKKETRELLK
jgi:hypothetical protein